MSVDPPTPNLFTFDPTARTVSYSSDNNDDAGVYTVRVYGTISNDIQD